VNPSQPRRQFNEESLQQLCESIRANGLIQPVVVTPTNAGYELIAGERRLRAARLAGLADIPVIVREVDAAAQARLALVENIHREDLNPIDRAESYRALMTAAGCTQAELAEKLGEQRSTIANFLRLLELTEPVRHLVRDGSLSTGHAKVLAGIDTLRQEPLARRCVEDQWSVRQLESEIAAAPPPAPPQPLAPKARLVSSPYLENLAKQLTHTLGLRVQVVKGTKRAAAGSS
jgi:ParB family chromosome partitioning protein